MAEAPIYIDDTPGLFWKCNKARRIAHENPLGLIIVDYLQLMQANGNHNGNRVQKRFRNFTRAELLLAS